MDIDVGRGKAPAVIDRVEQRVTIVMAVEG